MKYFFFAVLFLITITSVLGQERGTYQADSIYRINKVKKRITDLSGTMKGSGTTIHYDTLGRISVFEVHLNLGTTHRFTHHFYNDDNVLFKQIDSTFYTKPDKKQIKRLKKIGMGIMVNGALAQVKNKPPFEIANYEFIFNNGELTKKSHYNPDGTLFTVDHYENKGMLVKRDWYRENKLYRNSQTTYIDDFHKTEYSGWAKEANGSKREWNYTYTYTYDEKGNVITVTRFADGEKKETEKFFYNREGLLIRTEGFATTSFRYEYYD